ncbi:protein kinase domain-containing protein [Limoniibacter endophyticus]|uniref:mitogen-activated protein kinase kinase n=1 Tax=Limoniibacter endophyticus TaxID=1565040 RepID=A0A8J3DPN6_9HYPH|nr:protein kinase [Limoniibacter endophyticus]GHC69558.1 serine/threonine protein kinase [Limoniibacter endophyticus]
MNEDKIARHFRALTNALHESAPDVRDRVRDALDRQLAAPGLATAFIANSFSTEATLHAGGRYLVQRLRHRDLATAHVMKTVQLSCRDDGISAALLLREAEMAMRVQNPYVVPIQTVLRLDDGRPAMIMPDRGLPLATALPSLKMTSGFLRCFAAALLEGLAGIHAQGIVHCDIAPDNLLLRNGDPANLGICDFGIALDAGERHADHNLARAGRASYAAPEQLRGEALDARADLHAAGKVIERLLPGVTDKGMQDLCESLTQERREERLATASEALRHLGRLPSP